MARTAGGRWAAAALFLAALVGCGAHAGAHPPARPGLSDVPVRVSYDSPVTASRVVRHGGTWFAAAAGRTLSIYRWREARWVLDGIVKLPPGMPGAQEDGGLSWTNVTRGAAPDLTVHVYGADTAWFALAARIDGRWRIIPFDDQFSPREPFTFATGAEHGLMQGLFDSCGCASGPTTRQWYRFAAGVFVPTAPPNGNAVCSARALAAAGHWPPLPWDALVRGVGRPFQVVRFACEDGWALATDGQEVSVYEQNGSDLNHWIGRRWLRVGVGTPRLVGTEIDFALSRSLLNRLARRIGVRVAPAPPPSAPAPSRPEPAWQRAPINFRIRPGEDVDVSSDRYPGRPNLLTLRVSAASRTRSVIHLRWRNGAWVPA